MLKFLLDLPMIGGLLSAVGGLGPLALLPGGGLVAIGSFFASRTVKLVAIGIGLLAIVTAVAAVTIRVEHLEQTEAAYKALSADVGSLQVKYGCAARPPHEQTLAACLTAHERDAADAARVKVEQLERDAAQARADLDAANATLAQQSDLANSFIDDASVAGDGPMPKNWVEFFARERAARGAR